MNKIIKFTSDFAIKNKGKKRVKDSFANSVLTFKQKKSQQNPVSGNICSIEVAILKVTNSLLIVTFLLFLVTFLLPLCQGNTSGVR